TVVAVGRLIAVKGFDDAVKALSNREDIELVIVGEGPERERLTQLAKSQCTRLQLLGHLEGSDKWDLLRAADAFVMPSRVLPTGRTEGTPTALLEAMAVGLPIVATRAGGIPEVLKEGGTGLLTPPSNPEALCVAIDQLKENGKLRTELGRSAKQAAQLYLWTAFSPSLMGLRFEMQSTA